MPKNRWPQADYEMVIELNNMDWSAKSIAERLSEATGRRYTENAVIGKLQYERRKQLGFVRRDLRPRKKPKTFLQPKPEKTILAPDAYFVRAMLNAMHSGDEKVTIGVIKDRRPLVGKFIRPDPTGSIIGSIADSCADGCGEINFGRRKAHFVF